MKHQTQRAAAASPGFRKGCRQTVPCFPRDCFPNLRMCCYLPPIRCACPGAQTSSKVPAAPTAPSQHPKCHLPPAVPSLSHLQTLHIETRGDAMQELGSARYPHHHWVIKTRRGAPQVLRAEDPSDRHIPAPSRVSPPRPAVSVTPEDSPVASGTLAGGPWHHQARYKSRSWLKADTGEPDAAELPRVADFSTKSNFA